MNEHYLCPMEESIRLAVATDRWNESLTHHLNGCTDCQDTLAASKWMQQLGTILAKSAPPDPEIVWMMSRITRSSRRLAVPLSDGIAVLLLAAFIAAWAWSPLEQFVAKLVPLNSMLLTTFLVSCTVATVMTTIALNTEFLNLRRR